MNEDSFYEAGDEQNPHFIVVEGQIVDIYTRGQEASSAPLRAAQPIHLYARWKGDERMADVPLHPGRLDWKAIGDAVAAWVSRNNPWGFLDG